MTNRKAEQGGAPGRRGRGDVKRRVIAFAIIEALVILAIIIYRFAR